MTATPRIAIIGAMTAEVAALEGLLDIQEQGSDAGFRYWAGSIQGRACMLAQSGMGKVAAAACAQRLIDAWDVRMVLVCGLAGGLAEGIGLGDVVIGEAFVQHDVDASPIFPRYELPGTGITRIAAPPPLVELAVVAAQVFLDEDLDTAVPPALRRQLGIGESRVRRGLIVTGDQFVDDEQREQILAGLSDAVCVEMEGGAIAQVCAFNDVPFSVIRVVSDHADEDAAFDFGRFLEEVAPHYARGIIDRLLPLLPENP